jgi:hypothetical protein
MKQTITRAIYREFPPNGIHVRPFPFFLTAAHMVATLLHILVGFSKMADKKAERTFIMVKPDGVQRGLVGEIMKRFESRGYKLVACKMCKVCNFRRHNYEIIEPAHFQNAGFHTWIRFYIFYLKVTFVKIR